MQMLNLNDHREVKDFIYDVLVENRELKKRLDDAENIAETWYKAYRELRKANDELNQTKEDNKND